MIHGSFILADDTDTTVKIVFFAIVGVGWLLAQIAGAAKKSAKKTAQRPRSLNTPPPPFANTPPPPSARQPPLATFIGRPGGSATTLQDARRVAQARAVQARAAAARAAQLQAAQARAAQAQAAQLRNSAFTPAPAFPPPAPRRGEAAGFPPAAPPFAVEQLSKPLAQSAPASVVT
ncbi:MAG TPA: hypothetical protein VHY37_05415, partial [Tepidisphaeraceae bacterium]|nr:hypothetical protein [Tepidisphaeraceae bacterium]